MLEVTVGWRMDMSWIVYLSFGFVLCADPGSTHDPAKTLFLISGPEVLHAGTPTLLAVTTHGDYSGRVEAEVTHGQTIVVQTEEFLEGSTRTLTLPPISGSLTHNSLVNLTVRFYTSETLVYNDTNTLTFSLRNVSTFIQMDKQHYHPGDVVKVRVVCVQVDSRPCKGEVEVSVQDPRGDIAKEWESEGNHGIVTQEFSLPLTPQLGEWAILTTVNGVTDMQAFTVESYAPAVSELLFEVLLKTKPQVLMGDNISGSVRAMYPGEQPVEGKLVVSLTLEHTILDGDAPFMKTQTKEIYGSTQFSFSKDLLQPLYTADTGSTLVRIDAHVTDSFTGLTVNTTMEIHLMKDMFQLSFHDYPVTLKPSLDFTATLKICRYDKSPLRPEDQMSPVVIKVTQKTSSLDIESETLTKPLPEDGRVQVEVELHEDVEILSIQAKFQSTGETLRIYNNYHSPSGSYIQIYRSDNLPAQIGTPLQMNVESTFQPNNLHYVVSSGCQVLAAGTTNSSSFTLIPAVSWSPEAFVTVYSVLADGEITSDTACVPINQHNHVSIRWSSERAQPGKQVSLAVELLEPGSQVGVTVMSTHEDTLQPDLDMKVEQKNNIWMMTNGRLAKKNQVAGPKHDDRPLTVESYWSHWRDTSESLLWLDTYVSDKTWTSEDITVPDGVTSLFAVALVMSDNLGLGFTHVPQKLPVLKDFSLSLDVPPVLIRGEEIVLEVKVINHLEADIEVLVLIAQSEAFHFVYADRGDVSMLNAKTVALGSRMSAEALFLIRPVALGEMEICVDAISMDASDSVVRSVLVKPEGVEQSYSESLFLELAPVKNNNSRLVFFSFPPDVVPGSQRAHMVFVGDILALSFNNLYSLVRLPRGCGEQNMIHFAPSIYVLQYLDRSPLDDDVIRNKALSYMKKGYQRQLSFQTPEGSFGAFVDNSDSQSVWLTAFVLKCFIQAQPYIQIDQSVLTRARTWLFNHQGPQGEFREVGNLIHTEMQGGLDGDSVALTAYVLIALLEDNTYASMYSENVSLAKTYLENKVSSGVISNYSLCLAAYALALANSPVAVSALDQLTKRADYRDGAMMWQSSAGHKSHAQQPGSVQIEMAAYMLLALFKRGNLVEGIALLKMLSVQRNDLGGFRSTQDTVIALQALAYYAAISGAHSIDLRLNMSSSTSSAVSLYSINSSNFRTYQHEVLQTDPSKDIHLNIFMEGRGFAVFQLNVFYNLKTEAFSQSLQHTLDEEAFLLDIETTEDRDRSHMQLSICTRLKDSQLISQTGMAILDVGMLSGYSISPGATAPEDFIKKVEVLSNKVILYIGSLTKSNMCITLPIVRIYKQTHVQDAVVQVYDYYEPTRKATRMYQSNSLFNFDSCFFCGHDCELCRPGITITVTDPVSAHSIRSPTYGLICLLVGFSAFLLLSDYIICI